MAVTRSLARRTREVLTRHVDDGDVPGLVAVVGRGDDAEVVVLGDLGPGGGAMTEDALFRIASLTKPITAVGALVLVADGVLALDDPLDDVLPELSATPVLRTPSAALTDTVPRTRPITLRELLRSTSGHGFPADFEAPVFGALLERLRQGPPSPAHVAPPAQWMATLGAVPMTVQPGEGFVYNTPTDLLGVLLARVTGRSLGEHLRDRVLAPLGMHETGFVLPPGSAVRTTTAVRRNPDRSFQELDGPDGQWSQPPAFESGAGGLVATAADVLAFWRMLVAGGGGVLSPDLHAAMTADQLGPALRATSPTFLDGQGWGFGIGVDVERRHPRNVPGRIGWVGGTGTSAYAVPADGSVAVLLTQVELDGPTGTVVLESFWAAAAEDLGHG